MAVGLVQDWMNGKAVKEEGFCPESRTEPQWAGGSSSRESGDIGEAWGCHLLLLDEPPHLTDTMSAILSADDLNDFINPGVACIKPVETLPKQQPPKDPANPYEVTTEEHIHAESAPPAQISLTDCLACSGCVTSAEAVLVSLQSHNEVLSTLDRNAELQLDGLSRDGVVDQDGKIFVASVSPQTRASLAATYRVSQREAGNMIDQLLSGPYGLRGGGEKRSGFTWVVDTNVMRDACLVAAADEAQSSCTATLKKPILTSACPGWICYAEKTHPHILPHLSQLKSPQALTGTLLKSVLSKQLGVTPDRVWHMAVMPCFDKKLEASRAELTSHTWHGQEHDAVRDVDCVITARELLMLAESRDISFPCLPRTPVSSQFAPAFPDPVINNYLFRQRRKTKKRSDEDTKTIGTSGGYLYHVLKTQQSAHPGSKIQTHRGRNIDVSDYTVVATDGTVVFRAARYYGFRNIQNLVRRLKPARASRMPGATIRKSVSRKPTNTPTTSSVGEGDYAYVEVMACPGGCTNGGGQIKVGDVATLRQGRNDAAAETGVVNGSLEQEVLPAQREWLGTVDEAYWSADSESDETGGDGDVSMDGDDGRINGEGQEVVDGTDQGSIRRIFAHWSHVTGVELNKLVFTTYRAVESDVGKAQGSGGASEMDKVSALAVAAGGGW
nr:cytosolic fe-s cluster assembly factor nar1 [Quercus suber]